MLIMRHTLVISCNGAKTVISLLNLYRKYTTESDREKTGFDKCRI